MTDCFFPSFFLFVLLLLLQVLLLFSVVFVCNHILYTCWSPIIVFFYFKKNRKNKVDALACIMCVMLNWSFALSNAFLRGLTPFPSTSLCALTHVRRLWNYVTACFLVLQNFGFDGKLVVNYACSMAWGWLFVMVFIFLLNHMVSALSPFFPCYSPIPTSSWIFAYETSFYSFLLSSLVPSLLGRERGGRVPPVQRHCHPAAEDGKGENKMT